MGDVVKYRIPLRWQMVMDGRIKVDELDDEELRRGQLKDKNGHFSGATPKMVPRDIILAMQREGYRRHMEWVAEMVGDAQQAIRELTNSRKLMPGDATRLKAAEMILERYAGKVPDRVEMTTQEKKYERVLDDILVDVQEDDDEFD
jgi:hypothetical protein